MSLTASLQVGATALNASQLAIQVTGHNIANAATPGFTRQTAYLTPNRNNNAGGLAVGTGVRVSEVRRQIDQALQSRLYTGLSSESAMGQRHTLLSQIEASLGDLGEYDLASELTNFFNTWSERANLSQSSAVVVQQGIRLADYLQRVRGDLVTQQGQIDEQLAVQVQRADGLMSKIAQLNGAISSAEGTGGQASSLRDQRDIALAELSQLMEVTAIEQPGGAIDVLVGSTPVVLGARSRGLELRHETRGDSLRVSINLVEDGQRLPIRSGQIGATLEGREGHLTSAIDKIDQLASNIIFQVNRIHSTSTNQPPAGGFSALTGSLSMALGDRALALNDPANTTISGLPSALRPTNGGFSIVLRAADGTMQTTRIDVDLDGRDATGAPGFGDDTSLEDIVAALDNVPGLTATITPAGQLRVESAPGYTYSFTEDSSGVLAVLGMNSYFTGQDASDIAVRADLRASPNQLSVGRMTGGPPPVFVENAGALAMASVQDQSITSLDGRSIKQFWLDTAQGIGVEANTARTQAEAATIVRESLESQRAAISGVSIDEESINLLTFQRQYQGAARFIGVVDELTQVLMSMV